MENIEIQLPTVDQFVGFYNFWAGRCESLSDDMGRAKLLVLHAQITTATMEIDNVLFNALSLAYIESTRMNISRDDVKLIESARESFYLALRKVQYLVNEEVIEFDWDELVLAEG